MTWLPRSLALLALLAYAAAPAAEPPTGSGDYAAFVETFKAFDAWREWPRQPKDDDAVFPDFGEKAMAERRERLSELRRRLADMNVAAWSRAHQAEYLAVRSRFDQALFLLEVSRPWERDPGFYVDRMLRVTFTELPISSQALERTRARLEAIPRLVEQAKANLDAVAADYADLALHNLTHADGVGHGHPYRDPPPAGVIGWYEDLLSRIDKQPELKPLVQRAKAAVEDFHNWLKNNREHMTAEAGVGRAQFNWYLEHVKLMPYTAAEIELLGERELERLWAEYALERHRNRDEPELEIADSAEAYASRIERTDTHIREFLEAQDIITIPDDVGELDTNVPWIERPGGPNFWEQVQYRDPHPDHLHAVIPGHRFDGLMAERIDHPIRGEIHDDARVEGWATYLEEAMMNAGLLADKPRVRELIQIFGIFRAARVPADVRLQLNEMTVDEVVDHWMERVPYLDRNVARVDAEIYLRRPPGYGLGYTIGMLQMQKLLADVRRQQGEDFALREFHDTLMAKGRLPLSLIRWEMTGRDDEIQNFWARQPLPKH